MVVVTAKTGRCLGGVLACSARAARAASTCSGPCPVSTLWRGSSVGWASMLSTSAVTSLFASRSSGAWAGRCMACQAGTRALRPALTDAPRRAATPGWVTARPDGGDRGGGGDASVDNGDEDCGDGGGDDDDDGDDADVALSNAAAAAAAVAPSSSPAAVYVPLLGHISLSNATTAAAKASLAPPEAPNIRVSGS